MRFSNFPLSPVPFPPIFLFATDGSSPTTRAGQRNLYECTASFASVFLFRFLFAPCPRPTRGPWHAPGARVNWPGIDREKAVAKGTGLFFFRARHAGMARVRRAHPAGRYGKYEGDALGEDDYHVPSRTVAAGFRDRTRPRNEMRCKRGKRKRGGHHRIGPLSFSLSSRRPGVVRQWFVPTSTVPCSCRAPCFSPPLRVE